MLMQNFGVTKNSIMVCYGIFYSGQLPYRKITNKSMEISLTALEIVLLLLNNYFVLKSKDPVFKMGVLIMCFSLNRSFSKYTSHSEFLTPFEFVLFFEKNPPYAPLNVATAVQGALQQNSE